jgi:hypothetical protein
MNTIKIVIYNTTEKRRNFSVFKIQSLSYVGFKNSETLYIII